MIHTVLSSGLRHVMSPNPLASCMRTSSKLKPILGRALSNLDTPQTEKKQSHCSSCHKRSDLIGQLENIVKNDFAIHPLRTGVIAANEASVLGHYLAMSEAFPYLQAGAYKDLILDCIARNTEVSRTTEKTFVVGAFLSFDETGGNYLLRTKGISALPGLLQTNALYHSALLKQDIQRLLGKELPPNYLNPTASYLQQLLEDLGAKDPLRRCAAMVAFELHAGEMIQALWDSLSILHPDIPKDNLEYFRTHVGGDDPQEEYHKQLTKRLTHEIAPQDQEAQFLKHFVECYKLNFSWCQSICNVSETDKKSEMTRVLWGDAKAPINW